MTVAIDLINKGITKDWDWKTLAAYHSLTPHLNLKYRNKLIENFKELLNPKSSNHKIKTR